MSLIGHSMTQPAKTQSAQFAYLVALRKSYLYYSKIKDEFQKGTIMRLRQWPML